jgi:hypothetical protein
VTSREKIQYGYELAFYPPRLNAVWRELQRGGVRDVTGLGELLDLALTLHQALPESNYSSQRALNRLALYQAKARAYGMVGFLRNIRRHLGRGPLPVTTVPPHLVRDLALPPLARRKPPAPAG